MRVVVRVFKTPTKEQMGMDHVRMETLNELRKMGREMREDFKGVVANFSAPKPKVKEEIHLSRRDATASVDLQFEDSGRVDRVALLDKGTKGHFVAARRARYMRWRRNYRQKTRPRWIGSRSGGKSGPYRYSRRHWVKGIRARQYGETMIKRWEKPFSKRMHQAVNRGARKAG